MENCSVNWVLNRHSNTGWRRLIGSPKLQIIFHKRATKYKSLLRQMTHKDKGSYESSPPCRSNTIVKKQHSIVKFSLDNLNWQSNRSRFIVKQNIFDDRMFFMTLVLAVFECQIKSRDPLVFDSAVRFGLVFLLKHKSENGVSSWHSWFKFPRHFWLGNLSHILSGNVSHG